MAREENPIVEIRAKLTQMTNWLNPHSRTASALYKLILETLNLVEVALKKEYGNTNHEKDNKKAIEFSCIDVPIDINGRHAICDRARKMSSPTYTNLKELLSNSCKGWSLSSEKMENNGPPTPTLYLISKR